MPHDLGALFSGGEDSIPAAYSIVSFPRETPAVRRFLGVLESLGTLGSARGPKKAACVRQLEALELRRAARSVSPQRQYPNLWEDLKLDPCIYLQELLDSDVTMFNSFKGDPSLESSWGYMFSSGLRGQGPDVKRRTPQGTAYVYTFMYTHLHLHDVYKRLLQGVYA